VKRISSLVVAISVAGSLLLVGTPATAAPSRQTPTTVTRSAAPTPEVRAAAVSTYTVVRGDTLGAIARRFCGSVSRYPNLAAASGIRNPNLIFPGQKITLSCGARVTKASRNSTRSTPAVTSAWASPLAGINLTSCYGPRWGSMHQGLDMSARTGTPIRAVVAGRVKAAGWNWGGYGISVLVDHGNNTLTHYAHMSRDIVGTGQWVKKGQSIGYVGSTGDSTGPHLHFEVWKGMWGQVDPAPQLRSHGVRVGC
jgi:murein DD-endopeptidase MepM/ murein hydrolase activator NlpD